MGGSSTSTFFSSILFSLLPLAWIWSATRVSLLMCCKTRPTPKALATYWTSVVLQALVNQVDVNPQTRQACIFLSTLVTQKPSITIWKL